MKPTASVLLAVLLALALMAGAAEARPSKARASAQRRLEAHLGSTQGHSSTSLQLPLPQVGAGAAGSAAPALDEIGHPALVPVGRACSAPLVGGGVATGKCVLKCLERTNWVVREGCSFLGVCCIPKSSLTRPAPLPALTPGTGPGWWSEAPRSRWGMSWAQSPATTTPAFASGGLYRVVFHTVLRSLVVPDEPRVTAYTPSFDTGVTCTSKLQNVMPHFSVRWERKYGDSGQEVPVFRVWQHIPITHTATALQKQPSLKDRTGALCETNRQHAIQIEIVDMTDIVLQFPKEVLDGIGRLLRWIKSQTNVQAVSPAAGFPEEAKGYGDWPGRMTCAEWAKFNGVCGHSHVPCNAHGDPGALDIAALLQRMKA